jgi:hypothetical protein
MPWKNTSHPLSVLGLAINNHVMEIESSSAQDRGINIIPSVPHRE